MLQWFTGVRKLGIGICLLLIGIGCSVFGPGKGYINYIEYPVYVAGFTCFVNVLFSKITKSNIDILASLGINVVMVAILSVVSPELMEMSSSTIIGIGVMFFAVNWAAQCFLLKIDVMAKRMVLGFFLALMYAIIFVGVFAGMAAIRMIGQV